jgi:hypothetical protein
VHTDLVPPELDSDPDWHRTGDPKFPNAAAVAGGWWVLRLNCFPDHALYTLFINGRARFDLDDVPGAWMARLYRRELVLDAADVEQALGPVRTFVAYGSEVGQPCDNPFCCG